MAENPPLSFRISGQAASNRGDSAYLGSLSPSLTGVYGYDHRSRRVFRQEVTPVPGAGSAPNPAPERTAVTFSGGTSVAEYGITPTLELGPVQVMYVRGGDMGGGVGGLLYSLRPASTGALPTVAGYKHFNARGDVLAQSNAAGQVTWAGGYESGGKRLVEKGTMSDRQKANTKEEDPSGLLNEGFRYRDMEIGMFISRDPAGFVDGPNVYTYVVQNPWTKFDPEGLFPWLRAKAAGVLDKVEVGYVKGKDAVKKVLTERGKGGEFKVNGRSVRLPKGVKPGGTFIPSAKELAEKYPDGVKFNKDGFPEFSPYRAKNPETGEDILVKIEMTGNRGEDFKRANSKAGYDKTPEGFTWHHNEDSETMELIEKDIHDATPHTGGNAIVKAANGGLTVADKAKSYMVAAGVVLAPGAMFAAENGGSVGLGVVSDVTELVDPTGVGAELTSGLREIYQNDQLMKGRLEKYYEAAENDFGAKP